MQIKRLNISDIFLNKRKVSIIIQSLKVGNVNGK